MKIIKSGLILLSLMMMGTVLNAQNTQQIEAEVTQSYVQLLGKTPPVRTLVPLNPTSPERRSESKKSTKVIPNFVGRGKVENPDPNALPKGADPVRQTGFYKSSSVPIEPLLNIDGMDQGDFNATPPDPSGDIGHDVYLQMINATRFRVHDKEGNALSGAMGANTLWSSLGFNSAGDPIVLYDQEYKRWIMTEFPSGNQLLMAISDTQDPLGTWNVYNFGTPSFPDYPKYSIWKNAIVVTTNEQGAGTLPVYFIDRLALMNGEENVTMQRVTVPGVNGGPGFFVGTPVDWTGNVSPPEDALPMILRLGDDAWGSINQDQVTVYSFDIDFNNVTNTVVNTLDVPTAPFDSDACSAPGFGFACIPQLNGNGVDGIPDIIMNQVHYRNFISHESMTMNFIVNAGGDQTVAGIRWIEMRRTPEQSEWFVYQEGTFAPNDGMHRFMGGIAMDGYGNIGLAYNISSENDYVGMAFTGRQSDDPLGQMTVDEYILVEGGSTNNSDRFGDYAQMGVDPSNDRVFWYTGEYRANNGWATRIVAFELRRDTTDMGPARLTSPITAAELTDMEVMSVEVKNLGLETQTNFSVGYQIEGAAPVIEAVTFVLDSDSSYIHTFQTTEDFSTVEDYNIKLFTTLQDDSNLINDTLRVVVSNLPRFDASISGFENLEFTNCGNEISFQATIVNLGQENLTQATINNQVNGITTSAQIWTGNLDPGESVNYTVTFSGLSNGSSTLGVSTSNPNGMADERPANDGFSQDVTMLVNGVAVFLELRTDVFPEETTWEVEDEGGNVVFSGGPYTDQITVYTEEWCLDSEGCYDFYIYDGFGDGISDQGVIGDYNILDADGNLLANLINPNFGDFEVNAFCAPQVACNVSTNFNVSSVSEEGVADGMIMVSPISGIAPFTYSIDGGATFQDENVFGGLVAGEYTILTQDDNDCTFEETVAIETCALMASATVTNETITGEEDGKIIFSASNGTPFYNYFFDGDTEGTTSPVFNNLAAGTYEITIVDAEGCEVKDQVVVDYEILEGVDDVVLGHQITVAPNPTEGVFRIDVKGMETNSEVFLYLQVYDAAGKRIQNNNLVRYNDTYTGQLSLVAWPAGIYYVRFMDANIQDLVRVVKN